MLELINIYAHGYCFFPVINALKKTEFFSILSSTDKIDIAEFERQLSANSGYLRAALKMVESVGWISITDNKIQLIQKDNLENFLDVLDDNLLMPYRSNILSAALDDAQIPLLKSWIKILQTNKQRLQNETERDMLDGIVIAPLLVAIKKELGKSPITDTVLSDSFSPALQNLLSELFTLKGWMEHGRINGTGKFLIERAYNLGMSISYWPMWLQMPTLLFGDPNTVFSHDEYGHETHIDRTLNVVASGFQHEKYFSNVDQVLSRIFDNIDLENQPKYIADIGCGDGSFLHRVYTFIINNTLRGKNLAAQPLLLIGIDLNQKSLKQTELTLQNIPHITIEGDVGNPAAFLKTLKSKGISDPQNILHIRSFLDHEIPYLGVDDRQAADERMTRPLNFISIANNGQLQNNNQIIQRYVEHFSRWAAVSSRHGMLILEVHTLPTSVVQQYFSSNESFHFDAIHSFSRQNLLDAATFMQVTAEAGLFSDSDYFYRFPRAFPYTRVSLNWLRKKDYSLRNARLKDIEALLKLEELCWESELRVDREELTRRITQNPAGNIVIDYQGEVVGVGYTQRIASEQLLYQTTAGQVNQLHDDDAPVFQLLAINIHPEWQHMALGDTMLTYLLRLASLIDSVEKVVGVTRCKNYPRYQHTMTYEQYVNQPATDGLQIDPILHFHLSHGARIINIIRGYRPADSDNEGHGVLIGYAIRDEIESTQEDPLVFSDKHKTFAQYSDTEVEQAITARLKKLLGQKKLSHYSPTTSFRDMGLDSLDLTELRAMINRLLDTRLDAAIFFRFSTPESIINYLNSIKNPSIQTPVQTSELKETVINSRPEPPTPTNAGQINSPKAAPQYTADDYQAGANDIALVGISCRFPQGINDKDSFWQFLLNSGDVITKVPQDRWDPSITDEVKGASYGGFLNHVSEFDAAFFGISPREAVNMDPQQRLLLEISWQAFEDAGIVPQTLKGSNTGVFIGHFGHDYESLQIKAYGYDDLQANFSTATSASVQAGRLSYFYDFHGPAVSLNTACSSTLVAIHMASQSLLQKECDVALAGGANLILTPELSLVFGRANMLSADGKCKTFAASADGYVRSEGCAMVVLKRVQDAIDAGDTILAIIKGSAINQDGASNGLTAPNGVAQEMVIQAALARANIAPHEITYLETHGTGTSLGDPVEVEALVNVFAEDNDRRSSPLLLGAVKTRLGHTEAVAGLAGFIKAALILKHRTIPPMPLISQINPLVGQQLQRIYATINETALTIGAEQTLARAGISAFGYSGTNAHLILEEAPHLLSPKVTARASTTLPFLISAKTASALQQQAARLQTLLTESPDINLTDLAGSLATTRSHFKIRASILTDRRHSLLDGLTSLAQGETSDDVQISEIQQTGKLALLFTGQGSQYAGMGYTCYGQFPLFREIFDAICAELDGLMVDLQQPALRDIIFAEPGGNRAKLLDQTVFTQTALFALEVALFRLVESWGVKPDLLCGHSIGEVAAAHIAGVLSLQDACLLVSARARLMQAQRTDGAMVSLQASEAEVQPYLVGKENEVSIAALNGPRATVIAGDEALAVVIANQFADKGRRTTRLTVSHAFHSPHMDGMLDEFQRILSGLTFHTPRIPIISNLSGKLADPSQLCSPDYWVHHVRSAVRFSDGIRAAEAFGATTFLEIGPQGILTSMAKTCLLEDNEKPAVLIAALNGHDNDGARLMAMLATLHLQGHTPDWAAVFTPWSTRRIALPAYAFQRLPYWVNVEKPGNASSVSQAANALRYSLEWKTLTQPRATNLSGNWLLIAPDDDSLRPLINDLSQTLSNQGATVTLQYWSNIQPDISVLTETLNRLARNPQQQVNVLSLLAFAEQPYVSNRVLPAGFALNMQLLQAINHFESSVSCWLVTRSAVAATIDEPLNHPLQALNWGMARAVALEYPDLEGGIIDFPEQVTSATLSQLVSVFSEPGIENLWALRDGKILVPRLRHAAASPETVRWKPGASVLITGGTGAIGEHLTRWLCHLGAQHIILASRRVPDPAQQKSLDEHAGPGTRITFEQCDVADRQSVADLLSRLEKNGHRVSSVFHAAGVLDDRPLNDISLEQLSATLAGKVQGARNLSELLSDKPLDAFVLFSSIASVWGSGQQVGYAAANAYLDALAFQRHSQGLAGTSISWGMWQGKGMATEKLMQERVQRYGIRQITPAKAIAMLQESLDRNLCHTVIADVDWPGFSLFYSLARSRPLLTELPELQPQAEDTAKQNSPASQNAGSALLTELSQLDEKQRSAHLLSLVIKSTATVLGFEASTALEPDSGFFNLGLDSIMAVELREKLQKISGVSLPVTLVFDYPTPRAAATFLAEKVLALMPSASEPQDESGHLKAQPASEAAPESDLSVLDDDALIAAASALIKGGE